MTAASSNQQPDSSRQDPYRYILWSVLIIGTLIRLYLAFACRATEEDFYITLRYVENIASGHQYVYNEGQRVLGTTNPLYTLMLALFMRAGLDLILWGKLVGVAADAAAGYFTYRLGKLAGYPLAGLAAALCLALAPVNLTEATKGMEVGIVAAVGVAAWAFWAERRETAAWIAAAMLALLRIDGAALAVILLVATLLRDRKLPWRGIGAFGACIAPWFLFAAVYFGSPVPLSLSAKLLVYGKLFPGRFPHLRAFLTIMLHNPFGLIMALGVLIFVALSILLPVFSSAPSDQRGSSRKRREGLGGVLYPKHGTKDAAEDRSNPEIGESTPKGHLFLLAPLVWITLHYAGMALSHVPMFGWYFVPPTPIYYLTAMVGISMALNLAFAEARPWPMLRVAGVVAIAAVAMAAITVPRVVRTLRESQAVETDLRIPIGEWIGRNGKPGQTLMLEPIGYIGYYSRLTIIDVIGLVSPESLASYAPSVPSPDHDLWTRLKPDWLLLRAGQLNALTAYEQILPADQRLAAAYSEAHSWKDPLTPDNPPVFVLYRKR